MTSRAPVVVAVDTRPEVGTRSTVEIGQQIDLLSAVDK